MVLQLRCYLHLLLQTLKVVLSSGVAGISSTIPPFAGTGSVNLGGCTGAVGYS